MIDRLSWYKNYGLKGSLQSSPYLLEPSGMPLLAGDSGSSHSQ